MANSDFTQTRSDTSMKQEVTLDDLRGNIKWIGDNLASSASATFIELQDEYGLTAYVRPNELLTSEAFNRLSDYCKSRIENGLRAQEKMH